MSPSQRYKSLKGMQDVLPPDIYIWQDIEAAARDIFGLFGFREIRLPILESTDLFTRSIGENTDIVEKEMYVFSDRAGRSIALRPEGTASVVRAYVENHLYNLPSPQKYFYTGPMFRYERPQSGRFRQFYQAGIEVFGSPHPMTDAEVLSMLRHFLFRIGLKELDFQVNSIGCERCRPGYKKSLVEFFSERLDNLCPDCRRRYTLNPLRILDCKVSRCIEVRSGAPKVTDALCRDCRTHLDGLLGYLERLNVPFSVNPDMVRGLDYYTRTTFEVTSAQLGAQNAVAAGGRYDNLVREFGGPETPAVGFAMGMERLAELLKKTGRQSIPVPDVFVALVGERAAKEGILIADTLREADLWVELGDCGASLKSQLRRADKMSAGYVLILGDDEIASGKFKWKKLSDSSNGEVAFSEIKDFFVSSRPAGP